MKYNFLGIPSPQLLLEFVFGVEIENSHQNRRQYFHIATTFQVPIKVFQVHLSSRSLPTALVSPLFSRKFILYPFIHFPKNFTSSSYTKNCFYKRKSCIHCSYFFVREKLNAIGQQQAREGREWTQRNFCPPASKKRVLIQIKREFVSCKRA